MNAEPVLRRSVGLLAAVLLPGSFVAGQTDQGREERVGTGSGREGVTASSVLVSGREIALESTIDPARYYVGPSDVIAVNLWITPPMVLVLSVTPEGTLIIPTVGEVRVADMTLAEAKSVVFEKVRRTYPRGEVTVTLVAPRPVVVTVTGSVLNEGSYTLTSTSRVDKAIEAANRQLPGQSQTLLDAVLAQMSRRHILIRHKDGSASRADVARFLATKEEGANPYLREGDLVIVPRMQSNEEVIAVYGAVNVPRSFEYVRGDSVKDALLLCQGFAPGAMEDSLELHRLSTDGERMSISVLDGRRLLAGAISDVALEPGDRVVVRRQPDARDAYMAVVEGEVHFPGAYPITRGSTRLSEIIRLAGGLTDHASLATAQFLRRSVAPEEILLERKVSGRGLVGSEDSAYYVLETDLRLEREVVRVDFEALFLRGDSTQDLYLRNRDYIVIPERQRTVYVFGQVITPGHVPFREGMDPDYYIRQAGGFTEQAREGDVKIVKAGTRQWLAPSETAVEAGDHVWVPLKITHPFSHYLSIVGQTASIVSVGISLVLLVIQLNKD